MSSDNAAKQVNLSTGGRQVEPHIEIFAERFAFVEFVETRFFDLPCVYMMVHKSDEGVYIHYAGQTRSLNARYAGHHRLTAAKARGATHALILVAPDAGDRRALETLLRWRFHPPLNLEQRPTHMQAWRAAVHCGKTEIAEIARAAHLGNVSLVLAPLYTQSNPVPA